MYTYSTMTAFSASLIIIAGLITGCASPSDHSVEFRTTSSASFTISSAQFNAVEIQPSEIQLWQDSDLFGSIMTIQTSPDYHSGIEEVKAGYLEAQKGPGQVIELDLPEGAYGFSTSFGGHTTAFIALQDQPESWVTISARDTAFGEVLSSMSID